MKKRIDVELRPPIEDTITESTELSPDEIAALLEEAEEELDGVQ